MIPQFLLTDARELALAIAPELQQSPLYVIGANIGIRGLCTRKVAPAFRESLIAAGEWQGPGNLLLIGEGFEIDADSVFGVALHEAAHALPFASIDPTDREPTEAEVAHATKLLRTIANEPDQKPQRCPWHGPEFVRVCCHLQHRAARLGAELPFPLLRFAGWEYALPPAVKFARALGDEPDRMMGKSFAEILATSAPESFTTLFGE